MRMEKSIGCCENNIKNDLAILYARENLEIEIDIIMGDRETPTKEAEALKNWVLSTVEKRKFLLHVIRASMDNCHVTVQELVNKGVASRQAVMGFVKECEIANWVSVCRSKKEHKITAKPYVVDNYVLYSSWLAATYYTTELNDLTSSMRYLKTLKTDHECVHKIYT